MYRYDQSEQVDKLHIVVKKVMAIASNIVIYHAIRHDFRGVDEVGGLYVNHIDESA